MLDVNHSAQTGLTMRTIETIGAQRKLITSNRHVVDYPFYDPTRILLMDVGAPSARAIREFLEVPGQPIDPDLLECYSVDHWVGEIIGERDR